MTSVASKPGPRSRAYIAFVLKHAKGIWFLALLVCVPATYRTVELYVHLKSDIEELLPPTAPSVVALDELRRRNRGLQYLGVVVDTGKRDNLPAAEKLLDDLKLHGDGSLDELPLEAVRRLEASPEGKPEDSPGGDAG